MLRRHLGPPRATARVWDVRIGLRCSRRSSRRAIQVESARTRTEDEDYCRAGTGITCGNLVRPLTADVFFELLIVRQFIKMPEDGGQPGGP